MDKNTQPESISTSGAEEALVAIQTISQKTRHSIADGGRYLTRVVTSAVWLIGFIFTQYLSRETFACTWAGLSMIGGAPGPLFGYRTGKRVHSLATPPILKRVMRFWFLLALYAITNILIAHPADGKQATLFVVMFNMLGQITMGLLFIFFCLVGLSDNGSGIGGLFLLEQPFLFVDGHPWWGRYGCPRSFNKIWVVKCG
jgi:hypothetical protein